MWQSFWSWYERNYTLNISIALGLFLLQVAHLIWLGGDIVWTRLFGAALFELSGIWEIFIVLVDYTEIPAIISISLVYVNELRRGWQWKSALYLFFLNSQLLHIFWITDEVVAVALAGSAPIAFPLWLAWVAILIDYLELPVMVDVLRRFVRAFRERRVGEFLKRDLRE